MHNDDTKFYKFRKRFKKTFKSFLHKAKLPQEEDSLKKYHSKKFLI